MKKYVALLLSALLLGSLWGCAAPDTDTAADPANVTEPAPSDTASAADTADAAENTAPAEPSASADVTSAALTPVTSEEDVWALYAPDYEADPTNPPILSVTEYEGDYLVRLGSEHDTQWLDWVYGQSGIRRRMLFVDAELLDLEIESPACIRAVLGGPNIYNGVPGFPRVERVALNLLYDELGQALDYDVYSGGSSAAGTETYWANAGESWIMGMGSRREAIRSAQIDAGGITVAFAPLADGSDFTAAYCEIPRTIVALSDDNSTLTVTMCDTYLDSGTLKADAEQPFLDYLAKYGSLYPSDFPEGTLSGSCLLVKSAELHQEGDNAVLTVHLNTDYLTDNSWSGEAYFQFNGSTGYTGIADAGPYLRIRLRAATELFDD